MEGRETIVLYQEQQRKRGLPSILEATVLLSVILADFAVDLSVGGFPLVRVFFNQCRLKLWISV